MPVATLPLTYLGWHYTLALANLSKILRNLIVFIYNFFSLPTLIKTFFAPWRRLDEGYKKGFDPGAWMETFIVNMLMRLFGIFFRFWLILFGLLALVLSVILAILIFILWLVLPAIIVILFLAGLNLVLQ